VNRESVENMMERASKTVVLEHDLSDAKESFEQIVKLITECEARCPHVGNFAVLDIAQTALDKINNPVILGAEIRRLGLAGR